MSLQYGWVCFQKLQKLLKIHIAQNCFYIKKHFRLWKYNKALECESNEKTLYPWDAPRGILN